MNAHEALARQRKAEAIVDGIWESMEPEARISHEIVETFRLTKDQTFRDAVAEATGQRSPFEATWNLALELLAKRVKDARWGADAVEARAS